MTQGIENIEIYNPIGGSYGVFPVTDKCERSTTLMGDDYVKLSFSLTAQRFQFEAFSYIIYDGKHYFLSERYRPTPQGSNYAYEMKFVSAANMLSKSLFMRYYQVPTEEDPAAFRDIQPEPEVNVNADLIDIATILLRSIQGASDRVPVFSNTKTIYAKMIAGMSLDTDDMVDGTELKTFAFESNNIEEVLNNIAEQYKTEWWITESAGTPVNLLKLHICKCEQRTQADGGGSVLATPTVLSDVFIYKDGEAIPYSSKGLLSVGYAQEWSNIPQRIIPFGSDRNIVRTQALDKLDDKDVYVSYGKRLRLNPNHQVTWQGVQRNGYIVKQKDGTDDFLPVGSFGEVNNPNVTTGIEKTELFEDIYPQGHFLITKCELSESGAYFIIEGKAVKQNADGTPMKENGEYVTYTWREMCTPLGEDVFVHGDKKGLGLVPLQNKNQTEDLTIHFESGWLNGREFGVSRNNGVNDTEDGVTVQVLSLDIVPDGNEDEALALPNANFYPQVGDMFAIFNMDMPQGYVDMAEQRLAQATYEKLIEYQNSRPDVKCKSEPIFFSKLSAMSIGKRFAVFSELFGDIVYIDNDPDKGVDEEHSAVFTSRVTAYSHSLTMPESVDFTLASGMVSGRLASLAAMISDTSSELRGLEQRHINLSKRGWHDAEELSQMLESLTTEMMLVGNAKYQFGYTFGIVLDNDNMVISNVKHTKSITVQGGGCLQHTQKPYIDYPNQGLWYVDETEINLYQSNGTPIYDPTKPYYLYAIVNNTGARLTNQDIVLTETEQNGDMYMLLGVLSSEFEDEVSGQKTSYRIFSRTNGYTAIAGGTITTEQIQDANRQLIIDFQHMPPRIIARGGAEIIGNITFRSFKDESGNNPLVSLGRNLLRNTAFTKKGENIIGWEFYDGSTAGKTIGGCSIKTHADENAIAEGTAALDIKANHRVMLTQTAAQGYNQTGEVYTLSAKVKSSAANTMLYFGAGYSAFANGYSSVTIGEQFTAITLQARVPEMPAGTTNYDKFFLRLAADVAAVITVKEVKLEKGILATAWIAAPEDTAEDIVENKNYIDTVKGDLQDQIDGVVDSYFMLGVPTLNNAPAVDWKVYDEHGALDPTETAKEYTRHRGDTYTNIQNYTKLGKSAWENGFFYARQEDMNKPVNKHDNIEGENVYIRTADFIHYKEGDTLSFGTMPLKTPIHGDKYNIYIAYFGDDPNEVYSEPVLLAVENYTDGQALNANYSLCMVTFRRANIGTTFTNDPKTEFAETYGFCLNPTAGHSWRFCPGTDDDPVGTYHWHEIADSDAVKALQDAAAAQDTADGKRRVFTVQPVPPYDAGDLWANAYYPSSTQSDNNTYNNVLLKCKTPKAKGQSFAITDWEDSSRAIASADAAQAAADDAMQKALDIADDGIISGGTEKATLKKEWQEIAGDNMLGNTNGSYKKALDQAAAYGITVDTNSAIKTAYRALDDAMWIVIGYNGDTEAWTDEYMHVDTYLKNDDGTAPTVPTGANYLAKKRSEFSALWRAYYDAEIALLNAVSDVIDEREIGGENLYTKADPLKVEGGVSVDTGIILTNDQSYVVSINSSNGTYTGTYVYCYEDNNGTLTRLGNIKANQSTREYVTFKGHGGNLVFRVAQGTAADKFLNLVGIMVQKGEKPTAYQSSYKYLAEAFEHDATQQTTDIDGGLIATSLIKLRNQSGDVTAGMSGLDDHKKGISNGALVNNSNSEGVTVWGGGDYADALRAAAGNGEIPILLTKTGKKSRIGCFRVVSESKIEIRADDFGLITIDTDSSKGGIIISPKNGNSFTERVLIIPRNVDSYKSPEQKSVGAGQSGSSEYDVGESWVNDDDGSEINVLTDDNSINVRADFSATGYAYQAASGSTKFKAGAYLQRYNNGTWEDYDTLSEYESSAIPAGGSVNMYAQTGYYAKNYPNLPAGRYRVQGRFSKTTSGGANYDIYAWSWSINGYYYPAVKPLTVIGANGIVCANTRTRFFQVLNEAGSQQVLMAGLPTTEPSTVGQVWNSGGTLKIKT